MRHHQEAANLHAELARETDVLLRNIGLGAMRRDAHHLGAEVARSFEVITRADSRQQQDRQLRVLQDRARGANQIEFIDARHSILNGRSAEPVAMRDLDHMHAGLVESARDRGDLLASELMANDVRAIAQRDIANFELLIHTRSVAAPFRDLRPARLRAVSSPTRTAAAVIMSRLPE